MNDKTDDVKPSSADKPKGKLPSKRIIGASMAFIILMGIVSLFSDVVHEGADSVLGPFEAALGAPELAISALAGVATFVGYSLRLLTGWVADRTKKYWLFTILGYALDLVMIPLLALVPNGGWIWACSFVLLEKVGKAVKKPAKDSLVSFAAKANGTGKSFAYSEFLDQIGAVLGPIVLTVTYLFAGNIDILDKYRIGFAVLAVPALICLTLLIVARLRFKRPQDFEKDTPIKAKVSSLRKAPFILFVVGSCLMALGFVNFALVSARLSPQGIVQENYFPLLYAYAMLIDAIAALIFGFVYDKKGFISILIAEALAAGNAFFLFYIHADWAVWVGLTMWGIGMGAQESVMMSGVTDLSAKEERSKAFGIYEISFGLAGLASGFLIGWLVTVSDLAMCVVSSLSGLASLPFFFLSEAAGKKRNPPSGPASPLEETAKPVAKA